MIPRTAPHRPTSSYILPFYTIVTAHLGARIWLMDRVPSTDHQSLFDEIAELESRLQDAKSRLKQAGGEEVSALADSTAMITPPIAFAIHDLLVLSDSALPLGSFAFSAGLESYLAHLPVRARASLANFHHFLDVSLSTVASSILPYVRAAYEDPSSLHILDNDLDASTLCACARRASIAQGKALITLWERSLKPRTQTIAGSAQQLRAIASVDDFCRASKSFNAASKPAVLGFSTIVSSPNSHFGPLYGVVCAVVALSLDQCLYSFLLSHARMVLSAAIRASVLGPYQSQAILAGNMLRGKLEGLIRDDLALRTPPEDAAQIVPMLDLWAGRHEIVYSRIFNS